ncbi:hypothetical protein Scep_017370 [Stephania cephalantha]|uniref:Uncharacterized protein n=1 Tax=Stephania cephalantha TaxID=152367 RepID=A0AAP0IPH3_9MAGN
MEQNREMEEQTVGTSMPMSRPLLSRDGARYLDDLRKGSYVVDMQHLAGGTSRSHPPPPVATQDLAPPSPSSHMGDDKFISCFFHPDQPQSSSH